MKKFFVVALLLVSALPFSLVAQNKGPDAYVEFNSALGLQMGKISGSGLSYQTWFSENVGVQLAFGGLYFPEPDFDAFWGSSNMLDYSLGAEIQYRVYGEDYADWFSAQLYTFGGLNHSGDILRERDPNSVDSAYITKPYQPHVTLGVGIGIEVIVFRHLSIPFEIGYAFTWSPLAGELPEQIDVGLEPQFAFRYRY